MDLWLKTNVDGLKEIRLLLANSSWERVGSLAAVLWADTVIAHKHDSDQHIRNDTSQHSYFNNPLS